MGRWVLRNWASPWPTQRFDLSEPNRSDRSCPHVLHPTVQMTPFPDGKSNTVRGGTVNHVDTVRPDPRPPGCLPLPLLAGVALSPFDTAGCATRHQRRFLQPPCQSATLSPASVPAAATAASTARAIIDCAVASLPPPPSATLRRWRIGTPEGDAASPPRWRDPGLLRCSPPRAG